MPNHWAIMGPMYADLPQLAGRTIKAIWVSSGESQLVFDTDSGKIGYDAFGDCCSESWFADLLGVSALLSHKVIDTEEIPLPDYDVLDGRCRQEEDIVYGYKITTDGGYATLAFRNSSNGYYGGWITPASNIPDDLFGYRQITEDWSA